MAQIALSSFGSTLGSALTPGGFSAFGLSISGAAIGQGLGALAGQAIDGALFGRTQEGPRIESIPIMESREGAGIPNVYGRMRVGGQVIWASDLIETSDTRRAGVKGGPRVTEFSYAASFAVALCEGPIVRVARVWANGEELPLGDIAHRLYTGDETQLPDPVIEAAEGAGNVPAYRGTAYIVFEALALDRFGNRLPQLSFEIIRTPARTDELPSPRELVTGVNLIPASGEFVYGTEIVRQRQFPAIERPENMNNGEGRADALVSFDQLSADLPAVRDIAVTIGWFGTDLRAGECAIRPGVETREKFTRPYAWEVGGFDRDDAWLISGAEEGAPNYGGTPADRAVIEGLRELVSRGLAVTITPFLFMDIPSANGLADPYGGTEQAAFPWRGRITASDGTAAAREEITRFLGGAAVDDFEIDGDTIRFTGDDDDAGYRRFILHQAWLAKAAGGVEAFLIGSEMRALTRIRDGAGTFPFVEGLVALAADVSAILGPGVKVSYAADWTEYGAFVPGDGSNDVLFPLDVLWADPHVDFVGVDWYPPAGDWREGDDHLDAQAGFTAADDPAYLLSQMAGGEAFDYFYASEADRDAQIRTPIVDTAHGEHFIFRQKDLGGWWSQPHHERPGGVRNASPTGWVPGSKPVRLSEIGFPAVDKGGNSPNLFFDPGSSESALPPYSTGARDDVFQRRALEAALGYWSAQDFIDASYVWAWDARPYPDFPLRERVWSDGPNWQVGHWLNGRTGLGFLADILADIAARAGVVVDVDGVSGLVEGYALTGVSSLRGAIEALVLAYDLEMVEADGALILRNRANGAAAPLTLAPSDLGEGGLMRTRTLLDKPPGRLRLTYIDAAGGYRPRVTEARNDTGDRGVVVDISLPLVLAETRADQLAERMLAARTASDTGALSLPLSGLSVEPGALLQIEGKTELWRVTDVADRASRELSLEAFNAPLSAPRTGDTADVGTPARLSAEPALVLVDGPQVPGVTVGEGPLLAAAGRPWPGRVRVLAGPDDTSLTERAVLDAPAGLGELVADLPSGPVGRYDLASELFVRVPGRVLSSAPEPAVLAGENRLLVGDADGWELLSFRHAELVGEDTYRLTGLLRGLAGSTPRELRATGAMCVVVDGRLEGVTLPDDQIDLGLTWRIETPTGAGSNETFTHTDRAGLAWRPAHLRAVPLATGGWALRWTRRGGDISDNWQRPEADNVGDFHVRGYADGEIVLEMDVSEPRTDVPGALDRIEVSERGGDGRLGNPAVLVP